MAGYPLAPTGGLPTETEWRGLWNALSDVDDEGLSVAFKRAVEPLVEAYESQGVLDWSLEGLGSFSVHVDAIVERCEWNLEKARKLQRLREAIGEVIWNEGRVESEPPYGPHGGSYVPSRAALERFGLVPDAS